MHSFPTLQDFVLNLIYDPAARSAFELDPESSLHAAGLGDVTAADVQQVIPLVVDSAPVTGLHGAAGLDDLTTGVADLDLAGAVAQLQDITSQAVVAPGDAHTLSGINAAVISVTEVNASDAGGGVPALSDLSSGNDPALHLDHHTVVTPVETATDVTVEAVLPGIEPVVPAVPHHPVPELEVPGLHLPEAGSLVRPDGLTGTLDDTVSGVTGTAHDMTGGVLSGITHPSDESGADSSHDLLGGLHL